MSTQPVAACTDRPACGGAVACEQCLDVGHARTAAKLLAGGAVEGGREALAALVRAAWPECNNDATESAAVAAAMLAPRGGRAAVAVRTGSTGSAVSHAVTALLHQLGRGRVVTSDVASALLASGTPPRALTSRMLAAAGLHVVSRGPTRLVVRPRTPLNAIDCTSLVAALQRRGLKGAPLALVYAEYEGACDDVHALPRSVAYVERSRVWHSSVAPVALPGALARWREYKRKRGEPPTNGSSSAADNDRSSSGRRPRHRRHHGNDKTKPKFGGGAAARARRRAGHRRGGANRLQPRRQRGGGAARA